MLIVGFKSRSQDIKPGAIACLQAKPDQLRRASTVMTKSLPQGTTYGPSLWWPSRRAAGHLSCGQPRYSGAQEAASQARSSASRSIGPIAASTRAW